eukprot:CAMPEP_0174262386 /NCGR_PEP_ID=MMETSP0439-20130205/12944_1 /TAXON_ID=0 /ORGANISM="Stereomyxa ramosa, Strain Chinc5" /LENGTH=54 /DNA_ID=CAMNT_0015347083 /DNA_START=28 /DNA_END=189 /DNA_ORIENTATION=-
MASRKVVVKSLDMSVEMKEDAIAVAQEAFENNKVERDIAKDIKSVFDERYEPNW